MIYEELFVKFLVVAVNFGLFITYSESSYKNPVFLSRWKRHSCGENMFRCETGECINMDLVCDGVKNCKDRSDETKETCINSVMPVLASLLNPSLISYVDKCPPHEFRCDNGKCIRGTKRCDNKKDCTDGSDEKECVNLCRSEEFKCNSGSCLAFHHVCDGVKDCSDGSDETPQQCQNMRCTDDQFKCEYGACIRKEALCNGKPHCADGSDENSTICKSIQSSTTPPRVTTGCILPPQPENGAYYIGGCDKSSCDLIPGASIGNFAILNYTCLSGFKLSGPQVTWCNNAQWLSSFPTCSRALCPALINPTRHFDCKRQGANVNCSEPMIPGTKAIVRCESFYTASPALANDDITCLENGEWNRVVHSCTPECGIPNPGGIPFIANGNKTNLAEYPWHVGIFQNFEDTVRQKCGGSIVKPRVVITAAHCFWNEIESKLYNTENYRIAAGKYYLDWEKRTRYVQEAEIENVYVSSGFKGLRGLYAGDIAIVILKTNLIMNEAVRPICLDLDRRFSEDFIPGKTGVVVGWGFTENQTQSEELQSITLPYEDRSVCIEKTKESFIPFLNIHDKFCVGTTTGKSVCPGDSGGGFAVKFKTGVHYFLMGIVSAGLVPEGNDNCDFYQYSTFTKVSEHYWFIRQYMSL